MATKKVLLADVLWDAANLHLWDGLGLRTQEFSCIAAKQAEFGLDWPSGSVGKAVGLMSSLGCTFCGGCDLFDQFSDVTARQGVRYMWLLLAMHVAEDEGIEIEVEA